MSTAPALLPDGQVLLAGKSRIAICSTGRTWAASAASRPTVGSACSDDIDGGVAVLGMTVYLPCLQRHHRGPGGAVSGRARLLWSTGTGGGPPIVAAGLVWTIGQNGTLYGLDPATGRVRQQASIGTPANHFPTPSVGDGLLLAPSANQVAAFTATAPGPSTSKPATAGSTVPTVDASSQPRAAHDSAMSPGVIVGLVVGGLAVISGIGWFLWRRRMTSTGRHA